MSHRSYGSPSPGDINHAILDIGTDFLNGNNKHKKCNEYYIHNQNTDTIGDIISNHIGNFKTLTDKEKIKTKLLNIKDEVKKELDTNNECDKHVIEYYFEKKDEDIMKSRVKKALFGNAFKSTPVKSIFRFITSRKTSHKGKSPSRGGKTKKKRHSK